jgi:CUB domain
VVSDHADDMYCDRHHIGQLPGSGHITHLNFPFNYTEKQRCLHKIYIPPTHATVWQICFSFRRFQLENHSEPGFGDSLEFVRQLRFSGDGSAAMDVSKAPPMALLASDPRANIFFENLCC